MSILGTTTRAVPKSTSGNYEVFAYSTAVNVGERIYSGDIGALERTSV